MCAKFLKNPTKTVGVAIWKTFDDTQTSVTYTIRVSSAGCKQQWSETANKTRT